MMSLSKAIVFADRAYKCCMVFPNLTAKWLRGTETFGVGLNNSSRGTVIFLLLFKYVPP